MATERQIWSSCKRIPCKQHKKTSFEVKHCKIETVFILRSAQAGKLNKTYILNTKISGIR